MLGCFTVKEWTFAGKTKSAKVVDVYDGDTVTIVMWVGMQRYSFKFRLYGIDAPEIRTKNAKEKLAAVKSRDYLGALIMGKRVKVVFSDSNDKYGRLMGTIYVRGVDINQKMVSDGHAKKYLGGKKEAFV